VSNDVIEYLSSKGIEYSSFGKNEVAIICPECGKKKMSINTLSGKAQCWSCKSKDENLWTVNKCHIHKIMEHFGDILKIKKSSNFPKPGDIKKIIDGKKQEPEKEVDHTAIAERNHKAILSNKKALRYLFKRGISEESIEKFKIGCHSQSGQEWISYPSYENGIAKMIKYRQLPPENSKFQKCSREKGGKSILFNGDVLKDNTEIYVCEGEADTITLLQNGYSNAVGLTVGAQTLQPEWYDQLNEMSRIYLVLDSDKTGQDAARNVYALRLGMDRCWNIVLPEGEDVNSFFQKYNKEEFDVFVKNATRFSIEGIMDIPQIISEMYQQSTNENSHMVETPWPLVNNLMGGGLKKKHLVVVGGQAGTGKTTFVLQIAYHLATVYNLPSFIFCLEMSEVDLLVKIIQLKFDLTYDGIDMSDAYVYGQEVATLPLLFGYQSNITQDVYRNTVKQVRDKYGCAFFVFDNLHRWIRSDKESDYAEAVGFFKDIAMDYEIMMAMVAQPRKLNENTSTNNGNDPTSFLPTYDDLKGSSAIGQDADEVLLLHRRRNTDESVMGSFQKKTFVINDKARFASGGNCLLHFEPAKSRFYNITDDVCRSQYTGDIGKLKKHGVI